MGGFIPLKGKLDKKDYDYILKIYLQNAQYWNKVPESVKKELSDFEKILSDNTK